MTAEGDAKTPSSAALQFFAAELPAPLLRLALNGRSAGVVVTSEMVSVNNMPASMVPYGHEDRYVPGRKPTPAPTPRALLFTCSKFT